MDELAGTNNGSTKESLVCNHANGDDDAAISGYQTASMITLSSAVQTQARP